MEEKKHRQWQTLWLHWHSQSRIKFNAHSNIDAQRLFSNIKYFYVQWLSGNRGEREGDNGREGKRKWNVERLQSAKCGVEYQILLFIDHKDVHICNCNVETDLTKRHTDASKAKEWMKSMENATNIIIYRRKRFRTVFSFVDFGSHYNALRWKWDQKWFQLS